MISFTEFIYMYAVEEWGCGRQLRPITEVQMRAVRILYIGGNYITMQLLGHIYNNGGRVQRSGDGIRGFWVARIGYVGIEWTHTE